MKTTQKIQIMGGGLIVALLLAACSGSSKPEAESPKVGAAPAAQKQPVQANAGVSATNLPDTAAIVAGIAVDAALAAKLPANIAVEKVLNVGTNVASPPGMFFLADGMSMAGYDYDLIHALAARLGLKVKLSNYDFAALITSLQSKRIDVTISSMNDNVKRQGSIDFVDYLNSGMVLLVQKGNPVHILGLNDLCGKRTMVLTGTTQQGVIENTSDACKRAGKSVVDMTVTDNDMQNLSQLRIGKIDVIMNDLPASVYAAQTFDNGNAYEVLKGDLIDRAPYGIGVHKDNQQLRDAIALALDSLIKDGTYGKIIKAWGVESGGVKSAVINGGK